MRLLLRNRCIIKHIIVYVSLILSPLCLLTPHACPADAASHEPDAAGSSGSENQGNGIFTFNGLPAEEQQAGQPARALVMEGYGKLPLSFIRNDGQIDERVRYYERGSGHSIFFTKEGIYLSLQQTTGTEVKKGETATPADSRLESIRLFPMGGSKAPEIAAEDQQKGVVNYFVGSPEKWRSNIPAYSAVAYKGIYRGVDMRFYGNNRQLEYDVIVQPGASLSRVQLCYEGIDDLRIREDGDLEIALTGGNVVQKKPYMYQMIKGKKVEVQGEFRILKAGGKRQKPAGQNVRNASRSRQFIYGFKVASYDKRQPLVIDPTLTLEYSTYLGGSYNEEGKGIAVDGSGNAYITGTTWSSDFPIKSAYQLTNSGSTLDVFVTKINTLGSGTSSLVYSTYLGGTDYDFSSGIAVDGSGNAYITGYTSSSDFPTTPSAYQGNKIGFDVAFVTKLSPSGNSLVYSTYLGGSDGELGSGIAVDGSGNAYITGLTDSTNFPTTPSAYQGTLQGTYYGDRDAFVSKLSLPPELPNAITLVYFHASAGKDGSVTLTWETATEVDNAGFNLYRSRKKDGDYKKINDTLIPAMGNATTGAKYSYTDTPPAKGTYYYKLEDVDYNGISTMHGQEKVKVKIMSGDAGTKKSKRKKGR